MSNSRSPLVIGYCLVTTTLLTDKPQYLVDYHVKKDKSKSVDLTENKTVARFYDSKFFAEHVGEMLNVNTPYTFVVKEIYAI